MSNNLFSKIHDFLKILLLKEKTDILQYCAKTVTPSIKLLKFASKQISNQVLYIIQSKLLSEIWLKILMVVFSKISNFLKNCHLAHKASYQNVCENLRKKIVRQIFMD